MPGVVFSSPTVCAQKAEKSNTPRSMPAIRAFEENARRTRRHSTASRMRPAATKRMPRSQAGGSTPTTSFMTTKLKPQMMVATTRSSL